MLERGAEKKQDTGLGWSMNMDWNRVGQILMSFVFWCISSRSSQLTLSADAVKSIISQGQLDYIYVLLVVCQTTLHRSFAGSSTGLVPLCVKAEGDILMDRWQHCTNRAGTKDVLCKSH